MSRPFHKGHRYDPDDPATLPTFARPGAPRQWSQEQRVAWCAEQNERSEIVAHCPECDTPLVRGEALPHALKHAPNGRVRAAVGTVMALTDDDLKAAIALLDYLYTEVR